MQKSYFKFELKADEADEGLVSGYGSVFGVEDLGGDVVLKGAFGESLGHQMPKMLFQHDPSQVIGVWKSVSEDNVGLRIQGQLALSTQKGREVYELVKMGAMDGLSIGYRTKESEWSGDTRMIKSAELWEVSLVTFPMNTLSRIDAVKALDMSEREMERLLTQDAGLSRKVARALMSGGLAAVKGMQDAPGESGDLSGVLAALKARVNLLS